MRYVCEGGGGVLMVNTLLDLRFKGGGLTLLGEGAEGREIWRHMTGGPRKRGVNVNGRGHHQGLR